MNKSGLFIGISILLVMCIGLLFFVLGKKSDASSYLLTISPSEELQFLANVNALDTLYTKLQKAAYSQDISKTAEVNVRWEKQRDEFLASCKSNAILSKLSNQVLNNYRQRVKVLKDIYRTKSASLSEAEQLKSAIQTEEAKKEELKIENQMIKQALLTL